MTGTENEGKQMKVGNECHWCDEFTGRWQGQEIFYPLEDKRKWAEQKGSRYLTGITLANTFPSLCHFSGELKCILIKKVFYILFLGPDQSVGSLVNIFLKIPKCA